MKRKQKLFIWCTIVVIIVLFLGTGHVSADEKEMVPSLVSSLTVLDPIVYEKLVAFPIRSDSFTADSPYITLEEALETGVLEIKEVEGGRVPQVHFKSTSDKYIFVMGGEVLTGCKQDRIVGRDILLAPYKELLVPVYCVEHGRWTYESSHFYSKKNAGTYNLRSIAQSGEGNAQSKIWDEVEKMNKSMDVDTDSGAYQDAYEKDSIQMKIKECEDLFISLPDRGINIVGVIIGVGTEIVSVDVFATPALFKKLWPKILKASALSGILSEDKEVVTKDDALSVLHTISDMEYTICLAVGSGTEHHSINEELGVNALEHDRVIVHMAAFPPVEYDETMSIRDIDVNSVDMSSSYFTNMIPPQEFDDQIFLQQLDIVIEDGEEEDDDNE